MVEDTRIDVTVPFAAFEEWWAPYTLGVGPAGQYVAALDDDARARLKELCAARLPDGPFDVTARAWTVLARAWRACRPVRMGNSRAWTSSPPTPTATPGSPPSPCPSRWPTPQPTCAPSWSRRAPATRRGSRSRSSPSSCLSGYALDDLFLQDPLLDAVQVALAELVEASADLTTVLVVGAPLAHGNRVLNAAVVVHAGRILGVAPKSYLPTYREFYERRWFAPGDDVTGTIVLAGHEAPIGPDLLFAATDVPGLVLHVEVCEDMWVPVPPSAEAALAGATVLANLSGSPITIGRAEDRRRCWCARRRRAAWPPTCTPPPARGSRRPT